MEKLCSCGNANTVGLLSWTLPGSLFDAKREAMLMVSPILQNPPLSLQMAAEGDKNPTGPIRHLQAIPWSLLSDNSRGAGSCNMRIEVGEQGDLRGSRTGIDADFYTHSDFRSSVFKKASNSKCNET